MAFLNSLKGKVKEAASLAVEKGGQIKKEYDAKVAEQEAYKAEMMQKAEILKEEIITQIKSSSDGTANGIFESLSEESVIKFTKEFAEKIYLPANISSITNISMYPYINNKRIANIKKTFSDFAETEIPLIHFKRDKQEFAFTTQNLYFKITLPDDNKFFTVGKIKSKDINTYLFEEIDDGFIFKCNNVSLIDFKLKKEYKQDFITFNEYFTRIKNSNLLITDKEVNDLIKQKLGDKIYNSFKKYFTYDDETCLFFAWGTNSISAKDYIVCTNKQIIVMNREVLGATANTKQLYYDDITAIETLQNSGNESLTGYLLETALTAALDICDINISVSGSQMRINNLYKKEAERIVSIYHKIRNELKEKANQPVVIQQQANVPDPINQIQHLMQLKDLGAISEEEFIQKKEELMNRI